MASEHPDPEKQRQFALEVVQKLRQSGYEAYWAGGCVRDLLLGRTPQDYDVATNATPKQVRKLFRPRYRTLMVGAAFGVAVVVGPPGAGQVEVTTYRAEGPYSDGRHPDQVRFTTAWEDAQRRDFTINGMFYDPLQQQVLDYVGGQEDLRRGVIRAIGDPRERFAEDHLRMFRAVRFAARFGFQIEEKTFEAIRDMAPRILKVSRERLAMELEYLLLHSNRAEGVELLDRTGLLEVLIPEVKALQDYPHPDCPPTTLWSHTLEVLKRLPADPSFGLVLAALLHECGWPEVLKDQPASQVDCTQALKSAERLTHCFARQWKLSNQVRKAAAWLVAHHRALRQADQLPWSQVQPLLIAAEIEDLLSLHQADMEALGIATQALEYCRQKLRLPPEELNPPPLLTGEDLKQLGLPPGPIFSQLLQWVRDQQLDGKLKNADEARRAILEKIKNGKSR